MKRVYNIVKFENEKKFSMQIVSGFPTNKKIIISVMKVGSYASSTLNVHSHKFRRIIG